MSISGVLNRLSNYHTHLAKHDFLQLRFDYLIPHPTLICPKTITLFFVYELIYVIYLTRLKVFANYLHLLYSNLLIIRLIRNVGRILRQGSYNKIFEDKENNHFIGTKS